VADVHIAQVSSCRPYKAYGFYGVIVPVIQNIGPLAPLMALRSSDSRP
jgi:hypothetical protein